MANIQHFAAFDYTLPSWMSFLIDPGIGPGKNAEVKDLIIKREGETWVFGTYYKIE